MAVRVKLRIQPQTGTPEPRDPVVAVALVNSGYEAESPELIVPRGLAKKLGFWPDPTTLHDSEPRQSW
jgi:hypothetical protein